jgi:hypothetical protein
MAQSPTSHKPSADTVKLWFDFAWKAAAVIACLAMAWASRDNRVADHERRIVNLEVDAREFANDMTELKTGMATLLERTKNLNTPAASPSN